MFFLDGKPLKANKAFTDPKTGIQYPGNFLKLSTAEERAAIGITELPDYDPRFYEGYDSNQKLVAKSHAKLVVLWATNTRTTANTLLAESDWMVIRQADNGVEVPLEVKAYRQLVREKCGGKVAAIESTTTTEELAAYITGPDYPVWTEPESTEVTDSTQVN